MPLYLCKNEKILKKELEITEFYKTDKVLQPFLINSNTFNQIIDKESKIIYSCLNLEKELDSELYKDIATILNYILPTLPEDLRKEYQEQIREILEYAKLLINELYQTPNKEKIV